MLRNIVVVIGGGLLLAGCAVHRPESVPPPDLPPVFAAKTPSPAVVLPERWWGMFADPRLEELLSRAFAANLDLEQALARLEQVAAVSRQVEAGRHPWLSLDGSGGRGRQPAPGGPVTADSFRLAAAAGFEIDLWQKLKSRSTAAAFDVLASRQELQTLYLSLSAQLTDLYYLAVEQRAQLALTERTVAAYEDSLARVEDRYRAGLAPSIDVYQARQNLAAARARRPQFERTLAQAEHGLAVLVGDYPRPEASGAESVIPPLAPGFAAGIPAQLLSRRPDIAAALARVQAADARLGAAVAERFPAFSLTGSTGGASSELDDLLRSPNIFWNLLLNLTQPVIDGGRRQAEVERNAALRREALARYRQTLLKAFQEVEDALVAGSSSGERIARLDERLAAAREARRLAFERYTQGLADYLPVLIAQIAEFDGESQLLAARRQLVADRIALARALGGGWMGQELENRLSSSFEEGSTP